MTKCKLSLVGIAFFCLSLKSSTLQNATDDFSRDSGQWRFSKGGGSGKHSLQNARLEFSTPEPFTDNDSATHYWSIPVARFDESWEIQAEVFLGHFPLGKEPYAGLAILVGTTSHSPRSFIRAQLRRGSRNIRAFNADAYRDNATLGTTWAMTTTESATIRIRFDANTKILTASYDSVGPGIAKAFVDFYTIDIGKGPKSWKMHKNDTFEFSIVSQSSRTNIVSGDMFFDNVIVRNLGK